MLLCKMSHVVEILRIFPEWVQKTFLVIALSACITEMVLGKFGEDES